MGKRAGRGQSVAEYAFGAAVIFLAFFAMVTFTRRGLQGRYKDVAEAVSTAVPSVSVKPYEPAAVKSTLTSTSNSDANERTDPGGAKYRSFHQTNQNDLEKTDPWTTSEGSSSVPARK
ncbi:MAG: hypothetical protein ACM3OC_09800 [Deltaproteobacteria bacterium]